MGEKWQSKEAIVGALIGAGGAIIAAISTAILAGAFSSGPPATNLTPPQVQVLPIRESDPQQLAEELARLLAPKLNPQPRVEFKGEERFGGPDPETILLLLDTSASMLTSDVAGVVDELAGTFRLHDSVSIVTFDERVARILPFGHYSIDEVRAQAREFNRRGRYTDIQAAFNAAADAFSSLPVSGSRKRLIVVSDFLHEPSDRPHGSFPNRFVVPQLESVHVDLVVVKGIGPYPVEIEYPENVRVWRVSAPYRKARGA